MEVKKIPPFVPDIVDALLAVVRGQFVDKISDEDLKALVNDSLSALSATAHVLADDTPNDIEQVKKIWIAFINTSASTFVDKEVEEAINKIQNEMIRSALQTLRTPVIEMIRIVTDEIPNNTDQLEALWKAFIKDPKAQDVFFRIIDQLLVELIKNDTARSIAVGVWAILKSVIKDAIGSLGE